MRLANKPLRGIAAMVLSQLAFVTNDAFTKLVGDVLPMGEIIFLRGVFCVALIGTAAVALGQHRQLRLLWQRAVVGRMVGELGGTFFYIVALLQMPIAHTIIIFQAVPLTATAGAALFLRETVGWRRWCAIAVGFAGVVLVVRPGLAGFDRYALLVLVSVLFIASRDLWTRAMPAEVPTLLVTGLTAAAVMAMGALMGLTEDWVWPTPIAWFQLAAGAMLVAVGYFTVIAAMRLGEMSVTAPFRYVSVAVAIALGYTVWGDVPDALTILGTAVIVGAGLYTLYVETGRDRSRIVATPAPATNRSVT